MKVTKSLVVLFLMSSMSVVAAKKTLTLDQAIDIAYQNDPWLHGSRLKQHALEHRGIAASSLPDPQVSISLANLPTDTWDLDQEAMSQIKIGISQSFPRGDTLAIKGEQLKIDASKFPVLRADRRAKVKRLISQLWLDAYLAQQTIKLIEQDRSLFEQMVEVANASYATAVGKTRQQDVIRAQLEIIQLEDRLTAEQQKLEVSLVSINEWLALYRETDLDQPFDFLSDKPMSSNAVLGSNHSVSSAFAIADTLPKITLVKPKLSKPEQYSRHQLAQDLSGHPALAVIEIQQKVMEQEVTLAKQQYRPQWGVNATYGVRQDSPLGMERADLFSIGVTFDVPLFTKNRQDRNVAASLAGADAMKTEKWLQTKTMISAVEQEIATLKRLSQRQAIYDQQLLKQTYEQAEASLTAYTNDDGDFSEVVRARIAEQNARVSKLKIDVEVLKTVSRLNYYFTHHVVHDVAHHVVHDAKQNDKQEQKALVDPSVTRQVGEK